MARVTAGGDLGPRAGVHFPGLRLKADALTDKDRQDLSFGLQRGVDAVALSFVRRAADVRALREAMGERPAGELRPWIVAKLEHAEALDNLGEILQEADGVLVARGDLDLEVTAERVPSIQKRIIREANAAGCIVITATQMLGSMIRSPRPTRAEVSDVANAVFDGSDALMLSGETAVGDYPVETVRMMDRIISDAERHAVLEHQDEAALDDDAEATARAARSLASDRNVAAVAVFTRSGRSAEDAAKYHHDDLEVIHSGSAKLGIIEPLVTASGERLWVGTDKVPYRDESGNVAGLFVFAVDITERLIAEAALRDAHHTLERRVAERTRELATALTELRREVAERQRAEERISQHQSELAHLQRLRTVEGMTTQIAHEINQPLGAIANFASGLARWLRSDSPDLEQLAGIATQISQQAIRAAEVVRRPSDLVRKDDSARKACEVEQLVAEAVQMMASNARRRAIALRVAVAPELPRVLVDRIQIQQVVINLVANGLDGIDAVHPLDVRGGEPNEVIVEADRCNDNRIEIRVHDTGTGLSQADADKIFEPFYSTKPDGLAASSTRKSGMNSPITGMT